MAGSDPDDVQYYRSNRFVFPQLILHPFALIDLPPDLAFIDRADIKQYIGPPSRRARYAILVSCMNELAQKGLITRPVRIHYHCSHLHPAHTPQRLACSPPP